MFFVNKMTGCMAHVHSLPLMATNCKWPGIKCASCDDGGVEILNTWTSQISLFPGICPQKPTRFQSAVIVVDHPSTPSPHSGPTQIDVQVLCKYGAKPIKGRGKIDKKRKPSKILFRLMYSVSCSFAPIKLRNGYLRNS